MNWKLRKVLVCICDGDDLNELVRNRDELHAQLCAVHDALHAECDGETNLAEEIRTLRKRVEKAEGAKEYVQRRAQKMNTELCEALDVLRECEEQLAYLLRAPESDYARPDEEVLNEVRAILAKHKDIAPWP